jgi:hypothetical protein
MIAGEGETAHGDDAVTSEPGNLPGNGVRLACGEQEACESSFDPLAAPVQKKIPYIQPATNID